MSISTIGSFRCSANALVSLRMMRVVISPVYVSRGVGDLVVPILDNERIDAGRQLAGGQRQYARRLH